MDGHSQHRYNLNTPLIRSVARRPFSMFAFPLDRNVSIPAVGGYGAVGILLTHNRVCGQDCSR